MARSTIEGRGSEPRQFLMDSKVSQPSKAKVYLQGITSKQNARTIDDLRTIITNQIGLLRQCSGSDVFTDKRADVLLKLVKAFEIMDKATEKEHAKYDLTQLTDEELKALASATVPEQPTVEAGPTNGPSRS